MNAQQTLLDRSSEGLALRWLRIGFGFSQRELAAASGIPPERLAVAETGVVPLAPRELDAIAAAFEISLFELRNELSPSFPRSARRAVEVARIETRLRAIGEQRLALCERAGDEALYAIGRLDDEREMLLGRLWQIDERVAREWSL